MILQNFEALKVFLNTPKNIAVIGHRNPDGDAVGSTLGLKHYLELKGHKVTVIVPNEFPDFLHWLPAQETILRFEKQEEQTISIVQQSDITFLLDFNALHRVGTDLQKVLENYQNDFALIDHHQQPDEFTYMYSDTSMSSTCQMVYHFIEKMNDIDLINKEIATCLYTGIMTDTGSFRFRSTTSLTHQIIANLIDKGAPNERIHSNVYSANSFSRLQLLGKALTNMKVLPEYKTAYITITQADKDLFDYQKGDTDGIVNYSLSLKGIIFAAIFIEDEDLGIVKISFRSKGSFSVNQFSRAHFGGGGHDNAAGGKSDKSIPETVTEFINLLPQYKQELAQSYEV